jgi:hypothetical protein
MPHPSFPDPNPSWTDEPRQALAFFDGTFDNQVFTTSMCSWHDLRDMLQDRLVTTGIIDTDDDKNVMMITAALYRRHDDPRGYDPAPQKVFERDAWGDHVLDSYGQKVVREPWRKPMGGFDMAEGFAPCLHHDPRPADQPDGHWPGTRSGIVPAPVRPAWPILNDQIMVRGQHYQGNRGLFRHSPGDQVMGLLGEHARGRSG